MIPFPDKKYSIIYADPPWSYKTWSKKGAGRTAEAHYKTMSIEEICNLPVNGIAEENCILFLWATGPNLPEAFRVIDSWGFVYKTIAFTWVKVYYHGMPVMGLGYWTRANAELCLLATKGDIRRIDKGVSQVIYELIEEDDCVISKPSRHSEKPAQARDRIVRLVGDLPRIELFARKRAEGWDAWGNEVEEGCQLRLGGAMFE